MDFHGNGLERSLEFWPVEHPVEPMGEDRPVECPKIPDTSAINDENSYEEESYEILRRKGKFVAVIDEKEMGVLGTKTPRRVMRKRPHINHTQMGNDSSNTLFKISPLCPFPPSPHNNKFG